MLGHHPQHESQFAEKQMRFLIHKSESSARNILLRLHRTESRNCTEPRVRLLSSPLIMCAAGLLQGGATQVPELLKG